MAGRLEGFEDFRTAGHFSAEKNVCPTAASYNRSKRHTTLQRRPGHMNQSRIGPFSLEEKLGGKESSVHRAIHLEQRKQVVLKVFSVPFGVTEHAGSEFVEEMNVLR